MSRTRLTVRLSAVLISFIPAAAFAAELAPPSWATRAAASQASPVGYNDPYGVGVANGHVEPYGTYDAYTGELLVPATATPAPRAAARPQTVTPVSATVTEVTPVACQTGNCGPTVTHHAPVYHAPAPAYGGACGTAACGTGACGPAGCGTTAYGVGCVAAPKAPKHVFAQVESVFLFPIVSGLHNELFCEAATPFAVNNNFTRASNDFDDLVVAPRLTLGVRSGCYGVAFRYFEVQQVANSLVPFGAVGQTSTFGTTSFDLFTVDIEAQRYFNFCNGDGLFFAGLRHAEYDSTQFLANQEEFFSEIFSTSSTALASFNGTGVTFGGQITRQLFCSGFHLFGGFRGSVLFGDTHNAANTFVHASGNLYPPTPSTGPATNERAADFDGDYYAIDQDDELFILEVQLGGEYRFPLKCICADAFIRAAFEYQYWNATGAIASTFSQVTLPNGYASAGAISTGLDLDLIGFSIGSGLTW
ncbi:MAG: hypothetical protein AAGJ97_04165 [Planctomycetota bacterium]